MIEPTDEERQRANELSEAWEIANPDKMPIQNLADWVDGCAVGLAVDRAELDRLRATIERMQARLRRKTMRGRGP